MKPNASYTWINDGRLRSTDYVFSAAYRPLVIQSVTQIADAAAADSALEDGVIVKLRHL